MDAVAWLCAVTTARAVPRHSLLFVACTGAMRLASKQFALSAVLRDTTGRSAPTNPTNMYAICLHTLAAAVATATASAVHADKLQCPAGTTNMML